MAFISRPNLPEGLVGLRAQLMAAQPDPLVALMNAIGQVGAAGFESATKTREDKAKREADVAEATRREQMARESAAINLLNKGIVDMATQGQLGPALNQAMGVPGMGQMPASLAAMGVGAPAGPMSVPGGLDVSQLARLIQAPDPGIPMAIRPPAPKTAAPRVETEADKALKLAKAAEAKAAAEKKGAPGGGAAPAQPRSAEFLARGFADRATNANARLDAMVERGYDPTKIVSTRYGFVPGMAQTEEDQAATQLMRDFVSAVLRKESGAAIPPDELKNEILKYFPMPGDKPEVIANKRESRRLATAALEAEGARVPSKVIPLKPASGLTPEQRAARIAELEKKAEKK